MNNSGDRIGDRFKGKKIVAAPQTDTIKYGREMACILDAIGHPEAFVTDMSSIGDFCLDEPEIKQLTIDFGFEVKESDLLIEIAKQLYGQSN